MGRTARLRQKKRKHTLHNECHSSLGHDQTLINLISWLKTFKWKTYSTLYPTEFPVTGRGLMARECIPVNRILVQIPLNTLITSKTVDESNISQVLASKALLSQEILAAFLVFEKSKAAQSNWAPYINSLPSDYSTPLYIPLPVLEFLPDFIKKPIAEVLQAAHRSFLRLHELFPTLHEEEFKWAWSCVNTRAVYLPKPLKKRETFKLQILDRDCLALAPFLDLFNHSSNVSVEVRVTSEGYELLTHTPYKKYDQVFINYGPHANLKLFIEYGFALPDNPHDSLPLSEGDLTRAAGIKVFKGDEITKSKLKFLNSQGLLKSAALNRDGVTWSGLAAIRLLKSSMSDPDRWLGILYNDSAADLDTTMFTSVAIIAQEIEECLDKSCRDLDKIESRESNSAVNALRFLLSELKSVAHTAYQILLSQGTH